jgi:hypothetical protein
MAAVGAGHAPPLQALIVVLLFLLAGVCLHYGQKAQASISRLPAAMSQEPPKELRPLSLLGALGEARAVMADWCYIDALQYMGDNKNLEDNNFSKTYQLYREVLWLDPYFHFAVLEGCSLLVWGNHDLARGRKLMEEAMRVDPSFERYRLYYAAMAYTEKAADQKAMIAFLKAEVAKPQAPEMLLRQMGNLLSKYGTRAEALDYWLRLGERAHEAQTVHLVKQQLAKLGVN